MICKYAMMNSGDYTTYLEDMNYHMLNEKTIDMLNNERKEILNEASDYAKNILNKNKELLEKLVNALLEKGILDEKDLNEIFSK